MRFAIIDRGDENSRLKAAYLISLLSERGWTENRTNPDLVLCIGGDGTILRAIHEYMDQLDQLSFIGIHTGTLGFFTDFTEDELVSMLECLKSKPSMEEYSLIEAFFPETGNTLYALNEIRLESISQTFSLDITIDGDYFEKSNGSGICVSTQAGSTAINRSLNGAIIDEGLSVLQLVEIMPIAHRNHHTLRNPYVMRKDRVIELRSEPMREVICSYDNLKYKLQGETQVVIRLSEHRVRFARFRPYSYLRRLKNLF